MENQDDEKTVVVFRTWRPEHNFERVGEVIALFPEESGDMSPYTCMSYMHIGQHSSADPFGVVQHSTLSTPEEYKSLKEELESIGYNLVVREKITGRHTLVRKEKIRQWEEKA